jgi:hypothetical protein
MFQRSIHLLERVFQIRANGAIECVVLRQIPKPLEIMGILLVAAGVVLHREAEVMRRAC